MALFGRRRTPQVGIQVDGAGQTGQAPDLGAEIQRQLQHPPPGVFAHSNQVFAYLMTPVQPAIAAAIAAGDRDRYRQLMTPVYTEWIRQCPQAVSPRANSGEDFRRRTITFFVEGMVSRAFDPTLACGVPVLPRGCPPR